jgi:hypothetical protein
MAQCDICNAQDEDITEIMLNSKRPNKKAKTMSKRYLY